MKHSDHQKPATLASFIRALFRVLLEWLICDVLKFPLGAGH
jgi:hypothetical protein